MARPKGSTNKKTKEKTVEWNPLEEKLIVTNQKVSKIDPCGLKFPNEEMNLLVDKLNEVITYINNG